MKSLATPWVSPMALDFLWYANTITGVFLRAPRHWYLSDPSGWALHPKMASIFVDHATRYEIGEVVYVLITLPDRNIAGWTEGRVVSEEVWEHTIASNGEPSPRRFYVVKYGRNSAECHASPSHGNVLAREEWAKKLIRTRGGNWLDLDEL